MQPGCHLGKTQDDVSPCVQGWQPCAVTHQSTLRWLCPRTHANSRQCRASITVPTCPGASPASATTCYFWPVQNMCIATTASVTAAVDWRTTRRWRDCHKLGSFRRYKTLSGCFPTSSSWIHGSRNSVHLVQAGKCGHAEVLLWIRARDCCAHPPETTIVMRTHTHNHISGSAYRRMLSRRSLLTYLDRLPPSCDQLSLEAPLPPHPDAERKTTDSRADGEFPFACETLAAAHRVPQTGAVRGPPQRAPTPRPRRLDRDVSRQTRRRPRYWHCQWRRD